MARPDDFHSPQPHPATPKAVVNTVLSAVANAGTSLISLLSGLLAAALILYSGFVLYNTMYTQEQAKSSWDLLQYKPQIIGDAPAPEDGGNLLSQINPDYRAWLTVYDTNIDYPVMQGVDNLYYASHDIYGKEVTLTGSIYLAAGNQPNFTDSYNVIFGHHMDNGAMFGGLDLYGEKEADTHEIVAVDLSYFNAHREGILVSRSAVYDLYAFAFVKTDAYQDRIYNVGNRMDDVLAFLRGNVTEADPAGAEYSEDTEVLYLDEAPLVGADKIVALSTCASANTNGRLVVMYVANRRNLITVEAQGQTWTYDGSTRTLKDLSDDNSGVYFITNYPGDDEYPTVVEYSTDGGVTWTDEPPTVTNVSDSTDVIVRVTNELYGRATTTVRLQVDPKAVTVQANPAQKIYGQGDPAFTATVTGLLGNDSVAYEVVRPGAGTDETVNTYPNALVAQGDELQGNYTVTYRPADFTILPAGTLTLSATGFEGYYDAQTHTVHATANVTEGTTIEYSTDGGQTWSTNPPTRKNAGEDVVLIRAKNPNYETVTVEVPLKVMPRPVVVKANPSSKPYGYGDPGFSATITGLIGQDKITYTVTRPGKGTDEDVGTYPNAIVPNGEEFQGNYQVTYIPADFTITPAKTLSLNVTDYIGVYDGLSHKTTPTVNIKPNTRIEYSTDGGKTWRSVPPTITDVGEINVLVRAINPNYETVTDSYVLKVTPRPVTVRIHNSAKPYRQPDPEPFTSTVTGLLGKDTIEYTVSRPGAGTDEGAGHYPGAIQGQGEQFQGNYEVTFIHGDFDITPLTGLTLNAIGFEGVYDGQEHRVQAQTSTVYPEDNADTVIEYSVDNGVTWTTEPPGRTDVGETPVLVRATNPNYETVQVPVSLKITPRQVTVTVNNYSKLSGEEDPEFVAVVQGLLEGDEIVYTISREPGEDPGTYVITPQGDELQGNYQVVYITGLLRIITNPKLTPTPTPGPKSTPRPSVSPTPTQEPTIIDRFEPRGQGRAVWALVNLICLIITIYLFIPLLHLKAKFGRARLMGKINENKSQLRVMQQISEEEIPDKTRLEQLVQEARQKLAERGVEVPTGEAQEDEFDTSVETLFYKLKRFKRRFRWGLVLELIFAVLALVAFILTEDMRLPMVLIDKWTPLMIVLMMIVWVLDVRLIRYRDKVLADEEEAERRRQAREQAS
ncbi:MAG: sortase [Clostridia bacterium]|nr:sortase [Clostridia bacterium]